jgi:ribosomal protein L35AE/L33A
MVILQVEHKVPSFDGWKKAFDSDPVGRKKFNVRRYRIYRPADDPNYAMVDLELDSVADAEAVLAALRVMWKQVEGTVMMGPKTRIVELVESKEI